MRWRRLGCERLDYSIHTRPRLTDSSAYMADACCKICGSVLVRWHGGRYRARLLFKRWRLGAYGNTGVGAAPAGVAGGWQRLSFPYRYLRHFAHTTHFLGLLTHS